jgi:predicted DsbA family dithiol-disulfide isomerase
MAPQGRLAHINKKPKGIPTMNDISPIEAGSARLPRIDIVSDVICPWCFIGKRHLEQALAMLEQEGLHFSVHWNAFQLNPDMPASGASRLEYRIAKFGSLAKSQALDARITETAAGAGLDFHLERLTRTPNTVDAHRLVMLAGQLEPQTRAGLQDALMEAVFRAYFIDGRDPGDHAVLADAAVSVGLERDPILAFLASGDARDAVLTADMSARGAGVNGVPSFFLDGHGLFSGALPAEAMADAFRRAHQVLAAQAA